MTEPTFDQFCEQPFWFNKQLLNISASVGMALYPDDGDQSDTIIEKADQLMYLSKCEKKQAQV